MKRNLNGIFETVDAVLACSDAETFYLTGFCGEGAYAATKSAERYFTDARYVEAAKASCDFPCTLTYGDPLEDAAKFLVAKGAKTIGYDGNEISCGRFFQMQKYFPTDTKFMNVSDGLCLLHLVKTTEEIGNISAAAAINDKSFAEVLSVVKENMTENELAAELEYRLRTNGGGGLAFDTIAAFGENGSKPHAVPSERRLKCGDLVTLDFGCKYRGYCSDITRTFAFGEPNSKQKHAYALVLEANKRAEEIAASGVDCKAVDAAARSYLEENGFGAFFTHSTGHGVGVHIHELPKVSKSSTDILAEGHVFTVEPGLYIEGEFGIRIEDILYVDQNGAAKAISSSKKELIVL